MKSFILKTLITFIAMSCIGMAYASQFTVSKDPNRVAQYTNLQPAIDDAANGDTILVYGATTAYGNISVYKPIVLIGEGYNPNTNLVCNLGTVTISNFDGTLGASGTTIMGFDVGTITFQAYFSGATAAQRILSDITLLRNVVDYIYFSDGSTVDSLTNINIINSILEVSVTFESYVYEDIEDVTFSNCIFNGYQINGSLTRSGGVLGSYQDLSNVKVFNSLFLNYETGLLDQAVGMVFEDNIFFGHELYVSDYAQITWNHNVFYLVDQAVSNLFTNDNVGANNLISVDPQFTNYPALPAAFSYSHDYRIQAGSPALTASVGGGEVGIYGGAYPFAVGANPPVPQVTEITIQDGTSSVPVGGTINFNFKAQSGN
ncbi:hypothetical protein [Marinoscillum sp. MHG1-6]|uniref:hypothetical protein n=1 Tax=Marinoscillum sp. MHG1-6 TaxID=2959627 RepID=UPI00215711F9|nr:hypothetical protein [Marinoscillum sp. MHG1-6]